MTHPIGYYFQNAFNEPLEAAFGPQLNKLCYIDLSDLLHIVVEATAEAKLRGQSCLNMPESAVTMDEAIAVCDETREAIEVLKDFPTADALNLVRAIVDIMENTPIEPG